MKAKPLNGKVAVVAGSTRGAGRGIACMLGEAGASVYCTGRSVRGSLPNKERPETIDDTARLVTEYGGEGVAVQVDHTVPEQVRTLFDRVASEKGRLDILVNNANGDDLLEWKAFWELSLENGFRSMERGVNTPVSPLSRKAKSLIASNYRADIAVADIADLLGVSHAHLTRQFKRDYGLTPVGYRHRLRVTEAMGRLSQGEKILDVGYEVGFNDTTRFYEDFRKVTGTSPGKCRGPRN